MLIYFQGVFVKVVFLYNHKRVSKKKTVVVRKTENPIYNEAFVFKVPKEAMAYSSFKILVVNRTSYGRDEALGDITIGPQEYKDGLLHWNKMLMELRKPVAMWHPIIMN
jgi:Ca2+-dependent lipid-binding protein